MICRIFTNKVFGCHGPPHLSTPTSIYIYSKGRLLCQIMAAVLVEACVSGELATVQSSLTHSPDLIHTVTQDGLTLLMHSVIGAGTEVNPSGHYLETCQLLVQYGIALDSADQSHGRTAAHWATYYHCDGILAELIIAGSDLTAPDFLGTSPFHLAIAENAVTCLAQCLRFLPREILEIPDAELRAPLLHAVSTGNLESVELLLAADADPNTVHEVTGSTALHVAAQLGQGIIIELLLSNGAAPDIVDTHGHTPVHVAAVCESVESGLGALVKVVGSSVLDMRDARGLTPLMHSAAYASTHNVKFLLNKKVDVLATDFVEGKTALHWAAGSATPTCATCITLLLKKGRCLIESRDMFGRTPLVACAVSGCEEGLQALIEGGASVEAVDDEKRTPVHWATASGNYAVLPRLLEMGCPLNSGDVTGATPTHYAVQRTGEPNSDLLEQGDYEASLEQCKDTQACLAILLAEGAKVVLTDQEGTTPLHTAAQYPNNVEAISALLTRGADPVARDNQGMTPFHCAALNGVVENCQVLLERTGGIHGNDVDESGRSALHLAVLGEHIECGRRLLDQGLDHSTRDIEGSTALAMAAGLGLLAMVELLLSHGSTDEGAVHQAAANGHPEVLEYLLSEGAPVNEAVVGVASPLHYAVAAGHITCIQILLQHNADVNAMATNQQGDNATPLDYANTSEVHDLLTSMGAVLATEEVKHEEKTEEIADVAVTDVVEPEVGVAYPEKEAIYAEISLRPHTPTRPAQEPGPTFDLPPAVRPHTPTAPPPKAHLLQRALSMLRRGQRSEVEGSILSSAVGLYAAHATLLASIVIGTPLGDKAVQVAHSVATDTLLEQPSISTLPPDIVWLHDETPPTPSPTPPPPTEVTPTPSPPTPPHPVEFTVDPYERRLRKAMAQLDTGKSVGYLAVEELLRAGATQARLRRGLEGDRLQAHLLTRRQEFLVEESRAREASNKVLQRLTQRMIQAEQSSEEISCAIEAGLQTARDENTKISALMADMGLSTRPTVAQWLQAKDKAKRTSLQSSLITWDRTREDRHTSLLLQQARTSQRALRHAAWGAKKQLSGRIHRLRQVYNPHTRTASQPHTHTASQRPHIPREPEVKYKNKHLLRKSSTPSSSTSSCVRATPSGFLRFNETTPTSPGTTPTASPIEAVWADGRDFVQGHTHSRAIGPKTVHAERTLHFVKPDEYKARKKLSTQQSVSKVQSSKTSLTITSIDFETKSGHRHGDSYRGPQYVSHGSSGRRTLSPRQQLSPIAT